MEQEANQIRLQGTLHSLPAYSHENHGKTFLRFYMNVPRLSGTSDCLPVIAEVSVLQDITAQEGMPLTVRGQVRSHNIRTDGKRHLLIFVFATAVECPGGEAINECCLEGFVCRQPVFRRTPLGREICDVMLAVPRSFRRADYLPCILWGRTARETAQLQIRDKIRVEGRLQSRIYHKLTEEGSEERTAYEISVLRAENIQPELPLL